ncbi:MAG: hypothetical protein CMM59_20270 [Rhodospirillaceae bacterium]|nr:hypothetical protein [Rhodospirillaceae bacterium]|tara:strand:- start:145 stop:390 length:246 start_codon:yes stop_codon:yes gene_type:complete
MRLAVHTDNRKQNDGTRPDWRAVKDRLTIVAVLVVLLCVVFMMLDMAVINFQCSFGDFITFECNRWGQIWDASRSATPPTR